MKDHYEEHERAGVMPGNLENDRLLTLEEIADKTAGHTEAENMLIVRNLQDAKTSKWLVEKFTQWVDESMESLQSLPALSAERQRDRQSRVDTLNWAKTNLGRLAKEIKG